MVSLKEQYGNSVTDRCVSFCLVFIIVLCYFTKSSACDPIPGSPSSSSSSLQSPSSSGATGGTWTIRAIPHQSSSSIFTSYEQIQNLKYNWESNIDHLIRKIEMLESKIIRLDTSNQLRLEKLTESVNSKEIKDELAMEQMMRKMDANYERLNHKMNYMETRLDTTLNKIQTNMDNGFNRIETRQTDIDSDLSDINQSVDEIKILTIQMDDKHNTTQKSMQQHLQTIMAESVSRDQIDKLTGTIQNIGEKLNDTNYSTNVQNQNDATGQSGPDTDRIIQTLKSEVDHEGHRIENKISNMYNDLWRRFMSLEMTVKTVLTFSNATRKQHQEDLRTILQQFEKQRNPEPDSQESYVEILMDAVMNKVQELTKKVDSNFQMVISSQNVFMDNCHRLQLDEPQMESKISLVLEKILNTITNKTMRFDNRLVETMEMLKSHQTQVMRTLGHATKMVVSLTEEVNHGTKNFEAALLELAERNTIVAMTIQELQEDVEVLTNVTSLKLNNEIEEWFNKSLNESNNGCDNETEEITNKSTEEQSFTDPTISSSQKTPLLLTNDKNVKYTDSEEVLKIITEEQNSSNSHVSHNNTSNKNDTAVTERKISLIIPNKYFNGIENNKDNLNKNKLYKILLHDLLKQTGELDNIDDVDAVILNTESDKSNNQSTEELKNYNTTKSSQNDKANITIMNNTIAELLNENKNQSFDTKQSKHDTQTIIDQLSDNTANINETNYNQTTNENLTVIENKTNTTINDKIQNITDVIRNKLDSYKSQKNKINNLDLNQNNRNLMQFLQYTSQRNNNNNLKQILEDYNKKRKTQKLSKYTNTLAQVSTILSHNTQRQNETKESENNASLENTKLKIENAFKNEHLESENEKIQENEGQNKNSMPVGFGETTPNTNEKYNFNNDKKLQTDTDFMDISDTDQFPI